MAADSEQSPASSLAQPPANPDLVLFPQGFGQRVLLTIDTEEEFDWSAPFQRKGYGLEHVRELARFQGFCEEIGAHPVYLIDWPITQSPEAVEIIRDALDGGVAEVGVQLHPWVNPPFEEEVTTLNSFAGNLSPDLEAAKFNTLRDRIEEVFEVAPLAYRAGRYGVGAKTAALLTQAGLAIDTSVRTLFDYSAQGGPDFSNHPAAPYWVDGARSLLELPVTSVYWGVLRQQGRTLHRLQRYIPTLFGAFSRMRLLERIALTPEGVSVDEAIRGIDIALDDGLPLLVLSLHSPSLAPGFTPYASNIAEVEAIYEWLRAVYAYLRQRGVASVTLTEILEAARTKG
ncbi:MAG: polysaccharide deacetylase family protein [Erythrobacter sp.]|uniref:polysaccharide deacetylase family protein n=1 Tax=Erythrobacter sp. TaxID=1042 RepID=UPI0026399616|nr:polysaccharide deacetylase family protein [Erythrobacter sp.]MDJ0977124.1 polysaccharide deacetylase family protein [Erythrobacter sp.]